ncbi:hypothetical protein [Aeromonas jandaei]|uniref:hypothetical protein n=1 Tax=Aeromonas jandaei TaxID=650 RepID=UPI001F1E17D9|nr:hypothetical protein [Aeromonas jandaei]
MASKDASLALRKARSINGQLDLNQSDVVRLVGILNSTNLPPRLSASPGLVLSSVLDSAPHRSSAILDGSVELDAVLASQTHSHGELVGAFVIECTMASTSRAPQPVLAGQYDQNVFRGPASAMGDAWERADSYSQVLSSEWQKAGTERAIDSSLPKGCRSASRAARAMTAWPLAMWRISSVGRGGASQQLAPGRVHQPAAL